MAPFELLPNLVIRSGHLNYFQIWSPDCAICISSKFGHQMAPLALVTIALSYCLWLTYCFYQFVLSWYLHQPESHQLSFKKVSYSLTDTKHIDRTRSTWIRLTVPSSKVDSKRSAKSFVEYWWWVGRPKSIIWNSYFSYFPFSIISHVW